MSRQQYSERAFAPAVGRATLIWRRDGAAERHIALFQERAVTIGRSPTSTIHIDSPYASKNHAIVSFKNGAWMVEDLQSANGTLVNGQPIQVHLGLVPGDRIEIGDDTLQFVDAAVKHRAAAPSSVSDSASGGNKLLKLGAVAGITGVVLIGLMVILVRSAPTDPKSQGTSGKSGPTPPQPTTPAATTAPPMVDAVLIARVTDRAKRAGLKEADVLFDEGLLNLEGGRFRDAVQLLAAASSRKPNDDGIKSRLADAQGALDRALGDALAEASLAGTQLRYEDARLAWERILAMTYPNDPRNTQANDSLKKLAEERRKRDGA